MNQDAIDLFHRLADCSPSEREDYYARHRVPVRLSAEVESLLRFDGPTNPSLAAHVAAVAGEALKDGFVPEAIGHYRITSMLGQGGMGKVYRATDTRLGREVAIKIIPEAYARDAERMARFLREAKVLASLNHPGIAAIYGVEDRTLVLELVEGATLAERIAQGAAPLEEALDIASQIASALEAAHEKEIVHRDLKPQNVKIKPDGRVKVLDFGLATTPAGDSAAPGGPPAYMSPEQASGKAVDQRTDVWAFGVILYEMLTGARLFDGETVPDILGAVLQKEPDWNLVPMKVRRLLKACLEKDPGFRPPAIGDLRLLLEDFPRPVWKVPPDRTVTVLEPGAGLSHQAAVAPGDPFEGRFLPGTIVAHRYRIVNLLGRGGMGEVYRAMDLTLGQDVALKFLPEAVSGQFQAREWLFNEVRAAREITHPQVCRVHDIGEVHGQLYISMEFVDGENLASLLSRIGRLPARKASELAAGICAGLSAAHRKGLVHRDLKPANIMVDGRGQPRLMDFGLTASVEKVPRSEVGFGTPMYMAPEQFAGKEVTLRSDLYALGLILYELFTGQPPFEGKSMEALIAARERNAPVPMSTLCPEVTPSVEAVVAACLSPDPAQRPASAHAVAAALPYQDALAAVIAAGDTPSPELIAVSGDAMAVRRVVAYAVAAAILSGLLGLYLLRSRTLGDQDQPPEVLAHGAQTLAQQLGYTARPADTAYGFVSGGSIGTPVVRFWYRESDTELQPAMMGNFLSVPGRLTPSDPPLEPGMRLVETDMRGRLLRFTAIPRSPPAGNAQVDWKVLFASAGLDSSRFAKTFLAMLPQPVPADSVVQWTGRSSPNDPSLVITGASRMGQAVYFEVTDPARGPDGPVIQQITPAVTVLMICAVIAAVFMARRNLQRQRGDRQGAFRVGAAMFWVCAGEWVLLARHSFTVREAVRASFGLSWALAMGVLMCLCYLAIDPTARRIYPGFLVSLQQVLMGGRRDARLGRDILFGLGFAVLTGLFSVGGPLGRGHKVYDFSTPRILAGVWLGDLRLGAWVGLSGLVLFTPLLRLRPKRPKPFGALGVVIAETGIFCLRDMPAVNDVSGWYGQAPLLGYAAFALLTIYAARLAAGSNLDGRTRA